MDVIRGLGAVQKNHQGSVVCLGFFDGFHLGHQALITRARELAAKLGVKLLLYTFERHPLELLDPARAPGLLMTNEEKADAARELSTDIVLFGEFHRELAGYAPERFFKDVVVGRLRASGVACGFNYRFGKEQKGDAVYLAELARAERLPAEVMDPVLVDGEPVSSTRIRRILLEGKVAEVVRLLGRRYTVTGTVVKGEGRGKNLGVPTANLQVFPGKLLPKIGIYAGLVRRGKEEYGGVMSIGTRPTFGGTEVVFEVYLLDFDGSLYGETLSVEFVARIRDEEKFDSVEALVSRMKEDIAAGRSLVLPLRSRM